MKKPLLALVGLLVGVAVAWPLSAGWRAQRLHSSGVALSDAGQHAASIQAYVAANDIRPAAKTHYNMGLSYLRLRHPDQAAVCFRRALEIDPGYVNASAMLTRTSAFIDGRSAR